MGLKSKSIIAVNLVVIFACVLMGILGYISANDGFKKALQMKAESDVKALNEILTYEYAGDWRIENNLLYKGDKQIDGNEKLVDSLSAVCDGKVTIFKGDTRVATTVTNAEGKRSVGTQASAEVIQKVLKNGENFVGQANVMGEEHHAAYRPLKNSAGQIIGMLFVGVSTQKNEMDEVINSFVFSTVAALFVIVLICAGASNFFIRKIINMLDEVVNAVEKIAGGDLRIEDLKIRSKDEIGILAKGINEMRQKLKDLLLGIARSSEKVAASSEELTASAHQGADSINMVAKNTEEMTAAAAEQIDTVNILHNNIEDMSRKMHELHNEAAVMGEAAVSSANNAKAGMEKVNVAIDMMKNVTEKVSNSAQVVETLGKRSDEIGKIVGTISAIAEQTNLLALNAAIEAARAGEHGKGFAVVADEVRKLAEQSGEAASNISALIITIQKDTISAVESIEQGNASVQEGMQSVLETGDAFRSIEEQVEKLTVSVRRSMNHIDEVSASSHEISSAITKVQETTQISNTHATSVSASTQEQTATMEEIADASRALAELASDMQNDVAKFSL
ncbi:MAG: cache domain-containing protein [Selenomonadaceae bacterium]|nr:cache domain-containing protein [Selenomonadaceae bacterium]